MLRRMKTSATALLVSAAILLAACGENSMPANEAAAPTDDMPQAMAEPTLAEKLASESRPEEDRARDAGRKPADVIAFLGIEPGMHVLDVLASAGWYTEVLSIAVGPMGHVAMQNTPGGLQARDGATEKAVSARLANSRLPNVSRLDKEIIEIAPEDGPFDAAITALNLHDIYNRNGEDGAVAVMTAIYGALKPGGMFGVIDHEGVAGNDNADLHRMIKADAIRVAEAAGFVVEAESDVLHSDADDMTQGIRAEGLRGFTSRFVLRLRKPE